MGADRFVVLGVARARSAWFRDVAQWATSAAIPAEFVKCVSAEEVRAHLTGGRVFSAALLDAGLPSVDRDLIAAARDAGCVALVVDDGRASRDWHALGAAAVLPPDLDREHLVDVLAATATMVDGGDAAPGRRQRPRALPTARGRVAVVCGPGGSGASTAAIALAQQLAADADAGPVLLADLALRAEQAMLHDARDVVPGVQELVEAHRGREPSAAEVTALTYDVTARGYALLLGLRRARYWATIRPRSFEAAFDSLRRTFGTVVCDVTADFEGEDQGGSLDVEERNLMARTAVLAADAVLVVGMAGVKGLHALVHVLVDLLDAGVPAGRIVPVVNCAPRGLRARAEVAAAVAALTTLPGRGPAALPTPVFLPRRRVEEALRDGVALPAPLGQLLAGAFRATLTRSPRLVAAAATPVPVTPGTLGSWHGQEASGA